MIAHWLRALATKIDGKEFVDVDVLKIQVKAMNKYIGQTERYIVALEAYAGVTQVERLRVIYNRFDTKPLIDAGAWKEP